MVFPYSLARLEALLMVLVLAMEVSLPVRACAPAPSRGKHVQIQEESAVIVWNKGTHTEHFIRRAAFQGDTNDFGFLVPTPTVPRLVEAQDDVFSFLEERTKPAVIDRKTTGFKFVSWIVDYTAALDERKMSTTAGAVPPVRVLSTQRVAGYDAVVLEADRADALSAWLRSHGYSSRPALVDWLAPYIAAKWKITAFKIAAKGSEDGRIATSAVRMSFKTERPFFPYREPADQRSSVSAEASRRLQVFFLAERRMVGIKGLGANSSKWDGNTTWTDAIGGDYPSQIASLLRLNPSDLPSNLWMTEFTDSSSPRPGTDDVYFEPSSNASPVVWPPKINVIDQRVPVPVEPIIAIWILVLTMAYWKLMRPRSKTGQA